LPVNENNNEQAAGAASRPFIGGKNHEIDPCSGLGRCMLLSGVGGAGAQEKLVNEIGGVTIEGNSKVDMFRPKRTRTHSA
jgi:hypothetical protein